MQYSTEDIPTNPDSSQDAEPSPTTHKTYTHLTFSQGNGIRNSRIRRSFDRPPRKSDIDEDPNFNNSNDYSVTSDLLTHKNSLGSTGNTDLPQETDWSKELKKLAGSIETMSYSTVLMLNLVL